MLKLTTKGALFMALINLIVKTYPRENGDMISSVFVIPSFRVFSVFSGYK